MKGTYQSFFITDCFIGQVFATNPVDGKVCKLKATGDNKCDGKHFEISSQNEW